MIVNIKLYYKTHLDGFGVSDPLGVDPVFRLGVQGVVDFLLGIDSRLEFFEQGAGTLALSVEEDLKGAVGAVE